MGKDSKIEWCTHTTNLWWGCFEVHEGCDNCYARVWSNRYNNGDDTLWGSSAPRKEIKTWEKDLIKYNRLAKEAGEIHRVFVGSMMDIFEKPMPVINHKKELTGYNTDYLRKKLFEEVVPKTPNLLYLLLTKRPSNINKYIPESWKTNPPDNVMFGTSIVNQETANKLVPQLIEVKARRFLSIEPQLGEIDLLQRPLSKDPKSIIKKEFYRYIDCISWVIQGGESGHGKRPFNLDWAYSMKKQCEISDTPYFFKQIDKIQPIPKDLMIREFPQ